VSRGRNVKNTLHKKVKKTIDKVPNPCYNVDIRKREIKERKK